MHTELIHILLGEKQIFNPNAQVSKIAFHKLMRLVSNKDIQLIYSILMNRGDNRSLTFLVAYLCSIDSMLSRNLLLQFVQSEQVYVKKIAQGGIANLRGDKAKFYFLEKILDVGDIGDKLFAINLLGKIRNKKSQFLLVQALKKNDHEKIQESILSKLADFKGDTCFIDLADFIEDPPKDIHNKALGIFYDNVKKDPVHFFKLFCTHKNFRIRQCVFSALLNCKTKRAEKLIYRWFSKQDNSDFIFSVLQGKSLQKTAFGFYYLSIAYLREKNPFRLNLLLRELLHGRTYRHIKWIVRKRKLLWSINPNGYAKLLSTFSTKTTLKLLIDYYFQTDDKHLRYDFIDYIARIELAEAKSFLKEEASKGALSFMPAEYLRFASWQEYVLALKQSKNHILYLQSLLYYALNTQSLEPPPKDLEDMYKMLIQHENASISYLAIRSYIRYFAKKETIEAVLIFCSSSSYSRCIALKYALIESIQQDHSLILAIMDEATRHKIYYSLILYIVKKIQFSAVFYEDFFIQLLQLLLHSEINRDIRKRLTIIIKRLIEDQKSEFLEILYKREFSDLEMDTILHLLNMTNLHEFLGLRQSFFADFYTKLTPDLQKKLLLFFSKLRIPDPYLKNVIYHAYPNTKDVDHKQLLKDLLSKWIKAVRYEV